MTRAKREFPLEHKRRPAKRAPRPRKRTARSGVLTPAQFVKARLALGLFQRELGEAIGISGTSIYMKERGDQPITKRDSLAIEALLRKAGKWPLRAN